MDATAGGGDCPAIGIDLGTTYTCVAVWRHGKPEIIVNGQGNRTTPSFVAFTDSGVLVGDAAKNQLTRNPTNTITDAKRLIGRRFSDPEVQHDVKLWSFKVIPDHRDKPMIVVRHEGKEKRFSPEDISSMVLANVREVAESYLCTSVRKAVITVPAYFNKSQRQATKDAGLAAGLDVMCIIHEPTAAAVANGLNKRRGGDLMDKILVFDLGGGTFDVSVLAMKDGELRVLATVGDTHLGGVDFDNRMVDHCVREFKRKHHKDLSSDPKALRKLRTACERAKRTLSFSVEAFIDLEYLFEGIDFQCKITGAKFEQLNMDMFDKCMRLVDQCLKDALLERDDVDEVLLVGGSTRIPKVQTMLQELFSNGKTKISKGINPDEAVASGAASYAAMLCSSQSKNQRMDMVLHDVTPISLGINTVGGRMSVLIPKNTTIPVKKEKVFTTSYDNQGGIRFHVYEGESPVTRRNNHLAKFDLFNITPAPCGVPRITVCFEIDADGILKVSAKEATTEANVTVTVATNSVIDGDDRSRKRAKKTSVVVEARGALYSYAHQLGEILRTNRRVGKLRRDEKQHIAGAVEEALVWLNANWDGDENSEFDLMQRRLEKKCSPLIAKAMKLFND